MPDCGYTSPFYTGYPIRRLNFTQPTLVCIKGRWLGKAGTEGKNKNVALTTYVKTAPYQGGKELF